MPRCMCLCPRVRCSLCPAVLTQRLRGPLFNSAVTKSLGSKPFPLPFRPQDDLLARAIAQGPKPVDVPASLPTPPHSSLEEPRSGALGRKCLWLWVFLSGCTYVFSRTSKCVFLSGYTYVFSITSAGIAPKGTKGVTLGK